VLLADPVQLAQKLDLLLAVGAFLA
jgi:hypothetical protein